MEAVSFQPRRQCYFSPVSCVIRVATMEPSLLSRRVDVEYINTSCLFILQLPSVIYSYTLSTSIEETSLHNFLEVMTQILQNVLIILMKYFLCIIVHIFFFIHTTMCYPPQKAVSYWHARHILEVSYILTVVNSCCYTFVSRIRWIIQNGTWNKMFVLICSQSIYISTQTIT